MSSANNSDMEYSDNDCEYDDYYNSGELFQNPFQSKLYLIIVENIMV